MRGGLFVRRPCSCPGTWLSLRSALQDSSAPCCGASSGWSAAGQNAVCVSSPAAGAKCLELTSQSRADVLRGWRGLEMAMRSPKVARCSNSACPAGSGVNAPICSGCGKCADCSFHSHCDSAPAMVRAVVADCPCGNKGVVVCAGCGRCGACSFHTDCASSPVMKGGAQIGDCPCGMSHVVVCGDCGRCAACSFHDHGA